MFRSNRKYANIKQYKKIRKYEVEPKEKKICTDLSNRNIVVSADLFNSFESSKLRKKDPPATELINTLAEKKIEGPDTDVPNMLMRMEIKEEVFSDCEMEMNNQIELKLEDECYLMDIQSTKSVNEVNGETSTGKSPPVSKTIIIKSATGKEIKIIPKSAPVVLNKTATDPNVNNANNMNTSIVRAKNTENLFINHQTKPNSSGIKQNMPNFVKLLDYLNSTSGESTTSMYSEEKRNKIPVLFDIGTQTTVKSFTDQYVQTEMIPPELPDDGTNIGTLVEYILDTPEYSAGMDDTAKSTLLEMSKNLPNETLSETKISNNERIKLLMFNDLQECSNCDYLGNRPIHTAVLDNDLVYLERNIFVMRLRKLSIDLRNSSKHTALQLAVIHNSDMKVIKCLLANRADVLIQDIDGNNLLHLAAEYSSEHVMSLLLDYMEDDVKEINRKNYEGLTPLMIAAIKEKPNVVETLLKNNADPNTRDNKSGRTALFHAVERNFNYIITILLKYKADPKVRNYFGLTAMDAAKDLDNPNIKMMETPIEIALKNANGNSASSERTKRPVKYTQKYLEGTKKSKLSLSFVPSLQKINANDIKNVNIKKRGKK